MNPDSFESMKAALGALGLSAQMMRPWQLVVSSQRGPVWPNRGNSFRVTLHKGTWYLSTWSPVGYRVPARQDVVSLCSVCMEVGKTAMYRVPDEIASRFRLEELSEDEFDQLLH